MTLDVYVQGQRVGVLDQTGITSFVFTYLPDTAKELAVSLLMPPRTESWTSPFLFPVFQVSLPEGALRQTLERFFAKTGVRGRQDSNVGARVRHADDGDLCAPRQPRRRERWHGAHPGRDEALAHGRCLATTRASMRRCTGQTEAMAKASWRSATEDRRDRARISAIQRATWIWTRCRQDARTMVAWHEARR